MKDKRRSSSSFWKWLTAFFVAALFVAVVRLYGIESYRISTDAMEQALHKGDYVFVNKLPIKENPGRNRVVLFASPLLKDTASRPLFVSRCIGMPGDTIRVNVEGYSVNGKEIPRSPRSLGTYFVPASCQEDLLKALRRLQIPQRELRKQPGGITLCLTVFEEYQLREELPPSQTLSLVQEQTPSYTLIVPRKDRAYRLDAAALTACREAILNETGGKAVFRDGKLYLDGRETAFFFFQQDYYWMLSDNPEDAVDSRHLGFIPAEQIVGNVLFCWLSSDKQHLFKPVD